MPPMLLSLVFAHACVINLVASAADCDTNTQIFTTFSFHIPLLNSQNNKKKQENTLILETNFDFKLIQLMMISSLIIHDLVRAVVQNSLFCV